MIRKIRIRDWTSIWIFSTDGEDEDVVLRQLQTCAPPPTLVDKIVSNLRSRRENEGFTYSNTELRRSVVYVGPTTSGEEFLSSFVHELAHLVCDICMTDNISLQGERIAYMQGDIALRLSDIVCYLSCNHCRQE